HQTCNRLRVLLELGHAHPVSPLPLVLLPLVLPAALLLAPLREPRPTGPDTEPLRGLLAEQPVRVLAGPALVVLKLAERPLHRSLVGRPALHAVLGVLAE